MSDNNSNRKVIIRRSVITLCIILISSLSGFFFYKKYGQLKPDEVIPFYLKYDFGSGESYSGLEGPVSSYSTGDYLIDYYFKYGDYYESDSLGNPLNGKEPVEDLDAQEKPEDYSVISNIKEKTIDGFQSYYKDNEFVFLTRGHIDDGKVVFEGEKPEKEYKNAIFPIINNYMKNTIYENQTRFIPKTSPDYNEKSFQELNSRDDATLEYVYEDDGNEIKGVNIITPKYRTADLESFNIGMTKDKFANNQSLKHPLELVFLYGFLPAILVMVVLFLIYDSFSNFDFYKDIAPVRAFRKTPIEVKIISWIILIFLSLMGFQYPIMVTSQSYLRFNYITGIASLVLFAMVIVYIERSIILQIKLIYRYGFKNTFIESSILLKILKKATTFLKNSFVSFRKWIYKVQGDVGEYSLARILLISAAFFVIMVIAHGFHLELLVVPVMTYIIGKVIYRFSKSIGDINRQSSLIAEGNFDEKVDEEIPHFKVIAKNFNTIRDNINASIEEKLKAERLKTDLVANVSHDLKTPLTSIISYSSLLKEENIPDEMKDEYVDVIYEKATKLNNLIEDLFQISKISSNSVEFHKEKIDIVSFIDQVVGEFKDDLEKHDLTVVLNTPEYPMYCYLDGQKTYRVFENLITNILKYAQEHTRVYISLDDGGDKVRITLKNISKYELDISPEELQERFIRADKSRNTEGNGLGLSIATSFVEGQGGVFHMEIDGDLFKTIIMFKKYDEDMEK